MGFTGLLATDSLEMGALLAAGYPPPQAAAQALAAGADLLLFNHGDAMHRAALDEILAWVADGRIPEARLEQAALRVLETKARFGMLDPRPADPTAALSSAAAAERVCGSTAHRALSRSLAARAVQRIQAGSARFPLKDGLVLDCGGTGELGDRLGFTVIPLPADPMEFEIAAARAEAAAFKQQAGAGAAVIVALRDATVRHPAQIELVRALHAASLPLVALALRAPGDARALPEGVTALATYGDNPPALEALSGILR
jgi:beta-N-acetylhexosaminidase